MHKDSKLIFENYESGIQNKITTNFGRSEVIDGFAKVFANIDKSEMVSLTQALDKMLPREDLAVLLLGLTRHPGLKDKMADVREAGKLFGQYQKETQTGRYSPDQL
jgi:hypothetical protein